MPIIEITDANHFASTLRDAKQKLVVVDFFATWCGPCKVIAPKFVEWSQQFDKTVVFVKVDVDRVREVAQQAGVKAMPTFAFYHESRLLESVEGADARAIQAKIEALAAKHSKTAFSGAGYSLSGSTSSSSATSSTSKPGAGLLGSLFGGKSSAPTPAPSASSAGTAAATAPAAGSVRKNPWADPSFKPGGKDLRPSGAAAPAATSSTPTPAKPTGPANAAAAAHWANKDVKAAPAPAPTPVPAPAPAQSPAPANSAITSTSPAPVSAAASTTNTASSSPTTSSSPAPSSVDSPTTTSSAPAVADTDVVMSDGASPSAPKPTVNDPSLTKNLNATFLTTLMSMGFSQLRSEKALILTGNKGVEQAMEWLLTNDSAPDIDEPLVVVGSASKPAANEDKLPPNWDDMTDEEQLIYEQMQEKKRRERGVAALSSSSSSSSSTGASGKKSTLDMTTEEKMEWLANRRAEVKARREREELERIKASEKSRRTLTTAVNDLKEKIDDDRAKQLYVQKKKEEAAAAKAKNEIRAKIAEEKQRRKERLEREMEEAKRMKEMQAAQAAQKK